MSEKEQFIKALEMEFPITLRVLKAYPEDKLDWRPHEKSKSAKELAWNFVTEQYILHGALKGTIDFQNIPKSPMTMKEILDAFEKVQGETVAKFKESNDVDLTGKTLKFFVAPKTMGDVPFWEIAWMMLKDAVHHRGQFSVYLRMAGGMVPSIYGPSADEPWM